MTMFSGAPPSAAETWMCSTCLCLLIDARGIFTSSVSQMLRLFSQDTSYKNVSKIISRISVGMTVMAACKVKLRQLLRNCSSGMNVWDLRSTHLNLPAWHIYSFPCSQKGKGVGMQKAATMWETSCTSLTSCTHTDMKVITNGEQTCNLFQRGGKKLQKDLCNHNLCVSLQNKIHRFTEEVIGINMILRNVLQTSILIFNWKMHFPWPFASQCKCQVGLLTITSLPLPCCSSPIPSKAPISHAILSPTAEDEDSTAKWGHANKFKKTVRVPHDCSQGSCYKVQGLNYLNFSPLVSQQTFIESSSITVEDSDWKSFAWNDRNLIPTA